jgi:hypothetical protein
MGFSCFVIVAAIAASLPAPPAPRAERAMVTTPSTSRMLRARETIEPPPMAHGRRSAHRSVRRLVAAE